jgi:hypothetical protein
VIAHGGASLIVLEVVASPPTGLGFGHSLVYVGLRHVADLGTACLCFLTTMYVLCA